jgi:hypothetical protein
VNHTTRVYRIDTRWTLAYSCGLRDDLGKVSKTEAMKAAAEHAATARKDTR